MCHGPPCIQYIYTVVVFSQVRILLNAYLCLSAPALSVIAASMIGSLLVMQYLVGCICAVDLCKFNIAILELKRELMLFWRY